jgi:hypothetical protein
MAKEKVIFHVIEEKLDNFEKINMFISKKKNFGQNIKAKHRINTRNHLFIRQKVEKLDSMKRKL